ncbi:MAG: hypothetical protein LBC76_07975 [Treponema sp.]|jgi:hypothetical protein|nr:hypothetical protein [Treponema sp.]
MVLTIDKAKEIIYGQMNNVDRKKKWLGIRNRITGVEFVFYVSRPKVKYEHLYHLIDTAQAQKAAEHLSTLQNWTWR